MAASGWARSALVVDGDESLRWYEPTEGVFYGFCSTCGSTLFWRTDANPDWISIAAGSLDTPTGLTTDAAWWTETAGDYHVLDGSIQSYAVEPD